MSTVITSPKVSAWSPLRQELFRALFIASVVSNIGSIMHDIGASWYMATFPHIKPIWVSLMTTASSLPFFILGLPAGAIADVFDRKRLLLITQSWLMIVAGILGILTLLHITTPTSLLLFTFAMGIGNALNAPAWQAITPELVSREDLTAAVTLNGVGYNISRAIGPVFCVLIYAASGPWFVFILNALSFLGVLLVLYRWKRVHEESVLPAERMTNAIQSGLRYVRFSSELQAIFIWTIGFVVCSSSLWSLLPVLVNTELGLGVLYYGTLFGCLGVGAIAAAALLPYIRKQFSIKTQLSGAVIVLACNIAVLGLTHNIPWLCLDMFLAGIAWITFMSMVQALVQLNVPSWVRARALSCYLIVFFGSMASGSVVWGLIATHLSIPYAFIFSSLGLLVGLIFIRRVSLPSKNEKADLSPSQHWPQPVVATELQPEDGPVLVTVEFKVDPLKAQDFTRAMQGVRVLRRRDGAIQWGLYHDLAEPSRFVETYIVESWAEHLRQHERFTIEDRIVESQAWSFHIGENKPIVFHYIYAHHENK